MGFKRIALQQGIWKYNGALHKRITYLCLVLISHC